MKRLLYLLNAILFILMTGIFSTTVAQKVSNIQQSSVTAPAGLKIDGKLTEWGPALQAYNKSTKLWYTLANDDKNLYLAIKSTDAANINKILAGGISLTINTAGKKKDKDAFVITYPIATKGGGRGMGRGRKGFGQQDAPDSAQILALHKQALATCKVISAIGFKDITDTLISTYNEYSIKAVANFDDKGNFVYELAIPFYMLQLSAGSATEIAYQIKVNGMQLGGGMDMVKIGGGGGGRVSLDGGSGGGGGFGGFSARNDSDADDMMTPTDFWGKYTLATANKPPAN